MYRKFIAFLCLLFMVAAAQDEIVNIIVMDLFGQNTTEKELHELTVTLEKELRKTGKFIIHDRGRIQDVLDEYGVEQKDCRTIPWVVRIGKKLGMDKVVIGSVNRVGRTMTVHIRTVDMAIQDIDRSATEICSDCSEDVIFLKRIKRIAQKLAGFEVSDQPDDSLFHFKAGPLVELDETDKDSEIERQMKEKLFEDWRRPQIKRRHSIGMFLYILTASLLLTNDIFWMFMDYPPETNKRIPIIVSETCFGMLALPLLRSVLTSPIRKEFSFEDDSDFKKVRTGATIGIAVARLNSITYENETLYKTKAGLDVGLFLALSPGHFFVFQPELRYIQKGCRSEGSDLQNGRTRLNYLELPILFKGRLPLSGRFKPNILIGLSPAFLLSAKYKKEDLNGVSTFDLGFNYGFAFDFLLPKGTFIFEIRSVEGLLKLGENDTITPAQKNRSVSLVTGYEF